VVLGVAAAAIALAFLWHFPWRRALAAIASASLAPLGLALCVKLLAVAARAERTRRMLRGELRVGLGELCRYVFCGFAADNVLFSTAGIAVRGLLLVTPGGASSARVIGALALEKVLDGVVIGCGVFCVVHWHLLPVPFAEPVYVAAFGGALAVCAALLVWGRVRPWSRAGRLWAPAAQALGGTTAAAWILATSLLTWVLEGGVLHCSMRALGVPCGLGASVVLTTVGTLALVLPGVPSSAGTFEASLVFGLRALGLDDATALSAALVYHAVQVLPETAVGLYCLRGLDLPLRGLGRRVRGAPSEASVSPTASAG
jgi:uncharacterized membrane protein YbhN (UPF0104 family)